MTELRQPAASPGAPTRVPSTADRKVLVRADSQARSLGEGMVDRRDARLWSSVLEQCLRTGGESVYVENGGAAGLRIGDAWRGYERDHLVRDHFDDFDTVIVALGVNDWWPLARPRAVARAMERVRPVPVRVTLDRAYQRARPRLVRWSNGRFRPTDPSEARRDLARLVGSLRDRHDVALVTPLPVRSPRNPGFDGNTVEAAATVAAVAHDMGVPVIDTHRLFEPVAWDEVSADHVHVNPAGHGVIARAVASAVERGARRKQHERPRDRAVSGGVGVAEVVVRCDLAALGIAPPSERRFVADVERVLELRGHRRSALRDGCFRGLDVDDLHRSVLHDPLVREPISAASLTVLGVGPPRRVTAHFREAFRWLVEVTREVTCPLLVIPPPDPSIGRSHRRFAALVGAVGRDAEVPVVDLSTLAPASDESSMEALAVRLADAMADHTSSEET